MGLRKIWVATGDEELVLTITDGTLSLLGEIARGKIRETHAKLMRRVCADRDMWADVRPDAFPSALKAAREATLARVAEEFEELRVQLAGHARYAGNRKMIEIRLRFLRREERETGAMAWNFYFDDVDERARANAFDRDRILRRALAFPHAESDWISHWIQKFGMPKVSAEAKKYALDSATHKSRPPGPPSEAELARRWDVHSQLARVLFEEEEKKKEEEE